MSKQKRDDKAEVAEIVARHTKLGMEQSAKFVDGCSYFIFICERLGLSPECLIYDMADRIPRYYPIRMQALSYAMSDIIVDELAACAENPAALRQRVNEFMEAGE